VRAVGQPLYSEYIEAHRACAPGRVPLQEIPRRENEFTPLAMIDGGARAAEVAVTALSDLDERQYLAIEAYEVEFTRPASPVARQDLQAPGF